MMLSAALATPIPRRTCAQLAARRRPRADRPRARPRPAPARPRHDVAGGDRRDRQADHAEDFEQARRLLGPALRQEPEGQDRRPQLCVGAEPHRPQRPGGRRPAEGGRSTIPDDRDVLAAYGKALAAEGDLARALEIVRRAQTPDQPDWRLISAEAAILDQLGQHTTRRASSTPGARLRAERALDPVQSRHVLCADRRTCRCRDGSCARRRRCPAPTAASARTWRWWSGSRAASPKRRRSPAPSCRRNRRRPTSPT